jgi:PfaD family protein
VCLLPLIQEIRNRLQREWGYGKPVRVGAAGGLGTPNSIAAALAMGADYVVTGSVNQACLESGTSLQVKQLLAQIDMADVMMAPAPDMFEIGVKVQVLKRGTFYPLRGQKLYEIYRKYNSIEEISPSERQQLEQQIFQKDLTLVWNDTVEFFSRRNPSQLEKAEKNPKYKMALIFRWYLGKSSSWAKAGLSERQMDYQVWCGPAMGAFNEWTKGSYLEKPENRHIVDVTGHLLRGAAYCSRLRMLETLGIALSQELSTYYPNR